MATLIVAGFVAAFITAIGVFSPNKVRQRDTAGMAHHTTCCFVCLLPCLMLLLVHQPYPHQLWRLDSLTRFFVCVVQVASNDNVTITNLLNMDNLRMIRQMNGSATAGAGNAMLGTQLMVRAHPLGVLHPFLGLRQVPLPRPQASCTQPGRLQLT